MDYSEFQSLSAGLLINQTIDFSFTLVETPESLYPFEPRLKIRGYILTKDALTTFLAQAGYLTHYHTFLTKLGQAIYTQKFGVPSPGDAGIAVLPYLILEITNPMETYNSDEDWVEVADLALLRIDFKRGTFEEHFIIYEWSEFLTDLDYLMRLYLNDIKLCKPLILKMLHTTNF
jgi:hypothetical protein